MCTMSLMIDHCRLFYLPEGQRGTEDSILHSNLIITGWEGKVMSLQKHLRQRHLQNKEWGLGLGRIGKTGFLFNMTFNFTPVPCDPDSNGQSPVPDSEKERLNQPSLYKGLSLSSVLNFDHNEIMLTPGEPCVLLISHGPKSYNSH